MNIAAIIIEIRKQRKMTQEDFAKLFHVTRQTVSNWENEKSYPDIKTLVEISESCRSLIGLWNYGIPLTNKLFVSAGQSRQRGGEIVKNPDYIADT